MIISQNDNLNINNKNTKIKSFLCVLAIIFLFFPSGIVSFFHSLDSYVRIFQILGFGFIILFFLFSGRRIIVNQCFIFSVLILLIETLTTLYRGGSVLKALFECFRFVGIIWMITNEGRDPQSKIYGYLKTICYIIGILSLLFSMFAGVSNTSLFGLEGEFPNFAIPILAILFLDFQQKRRFEKIFFIVFSFLSFYCMIFVIDSSTAKVGSVFIVALVIFDRFAKKINPKVFLIIFAISFIAIVFFRITNYLGFFIEKVLNESITLHKRTFAWDYSIELIKDSPIIGYGYIEKEFQYSIIYKYTNKWFAHPHDELLRLYLIGGLFNVLSIIGLMISTAKVLSKNYQEKCVRIISYTLFTMLIMSIVETCYNSYFYLLIAFAFNSDAIIKRYGYLLR